jgi:arylsulfatase A-like enzyme
MRYRRRGGLGAVVACSLAFACGQAAGPAAPPPATPTPTPGTPNVVIILADDLGYGDLAAYGSGIRTPNLDRMAAEGARFTQFTVMPLCTPTRGALLTGLYPVQTGLVRVLGPGNATGIDAAEVTLAEALKARGYLTAAVGKWHLGDAPAFLPRRHGFDRYFGIPSDSDPANLVQDDGPSSESLAPEQLASRYTQEAVAFIRTAGERPFFLYLAHHLPHVPLHPAAAFAGKSPAGAYGDCVEELDAGVGEVLRALQDTGADRRTFVLFLSDNGPWIAKGPEGGSPGPLRAGKGTPNEGGVRVPAIARWPGQVPAGRVLTDPANVVDVFPTVVALAGAQMPTHKRYFGQDLRPLLRGEVSHLTGSGIDGGREFLVFVGDDAVAIRSGRYKYVWDGWWALQPGLFDLDADPGEDRDLSRAQPEMVQRVLGRLDALGTAVGAGAPAPK